MNVQTLNDIFFANVERGLVRLMLVREVDQWVPISSQEFYQDVARRGAGAPPVGSEQR